jgi:predicted Ser/Thr protein kinase
VSEPSTPPSSTRIGDAALAHLRAVIDAPDVGGTRYELEEPIGRGGMGVVWRARDRELDREVALKVLSDPEAETAPDFAARLVREAKVLARLEHPGIVPVHDVGMLPDGRAFCAMKLVRGRRLDELARAGLPEVERFRIFTRACEAVAFAHARGVLHRDLKPGNVMVGEFGEVLVLDWGLAKVRAVGAAAAPAGADGEVRGTRVGTPGYMAPEQEQGEVDVDQRADVFSLGVLLGFLWGGERAQPRALRAIVAKSTAPRPADRYPSALELLADVARFQSDEPVSALQEGPLRRLARLYRRYRGVIWLIASYVAFRVGFELWRVYVRPRLG